LGYPLAESSRADEAQSLYLLARVDQDAQAAAGATTESRRDLAATAFGIAELLASMGEPAEAEAKYCKMLALYQTLAEDNRGPADYRQVGLGHYDIGNMLLARGNSLEAEVEGWGWLRPSGAIDVVLGVLIWRELPMSGLTMIGVLVGTSLSVRGVSWLMVGFALKRIPATAA
jgi:hypothetical protein